jgi:hypothetical protein
MKTSSDLLPGCPTSAVEVNRSLDKDKDLSPCSLGQHARSSLEVVNVVESLKRLMHSLELIDEFLTGAVWWSVTAGFINQQLDAEIVEVALVHVVKLTLTRRTLSSLS